MRQKATTKKGDEEGKAATAITSREKKPRGEHGVKKGGMYYNPNDPKGKRKENTPERKEGWRASKTVRPENGGGRGRNGRRLLRKRAKRRTEEETHPTRQITKDKEW